jgi:hypothetical protein
MTAWLCGVQVILQEADFANNDHLQETIEAAQVRIEICVLITGYILYQEHLKIKLEKDNNVIIFKLALFSSVTDPQRFHTDPDPVLSSMAFKVLTKNILIFFFILLTVGITSVFKENKIFEVTML